MPDHDTTCPCGRTDTVHRCHVTHSPMCVACFKLLGDFRRWLRDDAAFYAELETWEHMQPRRSARPADLPEPLVPAAPVRDRVARLQRLHLRRSRMPVIVTDPGARVARRIEQPLDRVGVRRQPARSGRPGRDSGAPACSTCGRRGSARTARRSDDRRLDQPRLRSFHGRVTRGIRAYPAVSGGCPLVVPGLR